MAIKAKISDSTSGPAQVSVTVPAQVQVDINNTDDLSEGSTNLYYTETRGTATVVNQLQYITSTGLATINNGDINIKISDIIIEHIKISLNPLLYHFHRKEAHEIEPRKEVRMMLGIWLPVVQLKHLVNFQINCFPWLV